MKPGSITVPVTVEVEFTGSGADLGRLVNRLHHAEALAESRKARLDAISSLRDRWVATLSRDLDDRPDPRVVLRACTERLSEHLDGVPSSPREL